MEDGGCPRLEMLVEETIEAHVGVLDVVRAGNLNQHLFINHVMKTTCALVLPSGANHQPLYSQPLCALGVLAVGVVACSVVACVWSSPEAHHQLDEPAQLGRVVA